LTNPIKILGMDPAFRNFGMAKANINPKTLIYLPYDLKLIQTEKNAENKSVAEDVIRRVKYIRSISEDYCAGTDICIAEIPTGGGKSANAIKAMSYATVLSVIDHKIPLIHVTPREVKLATVGKATATKEEMIEWAYSKWPDLNWPKKKSKGGLELVTGKCEHLADAIAAIEAGTQKQEFLETINARYK